MRTLCAIVSVLGVCLLTKTAAAITTATCFTPLFGFGPIDPVDGFPQYYQDSNGLALQQCLDAVCGGVGFVLPDPNLPLSFPDNFPVEVFYSRAISKMTVGPILATYVAALEGSFANGNVALPGDQVVFTRVRVRILGAAPGGTYTITHPYGVEVLQADTLGTGPARPLARRQHLEVLPSSKWTCRPCHSQSAGARSSSCRPRCVASRRRAASGRRERARQ